MAAASIGNCFEKRLEDVMAWAEGQDEIFPFMRIHPYEKGTVKNISKAVDMGIAGFKMICSNFYVYDKKSMRVIREIAETGKPIIFHAGSLWDWKASAKYNNPFNWEELVNVPNLKFSLAHFAWPWHDSLVAMYGKFKYVQRTRGNAPELFIDLSPGAPKIYRKDIFSKFFDIYPNIADSMMFGVDTNTNTYNVNMAKGYIETDKAILDELSVPEADQEKIFYKNLLRFVGKEEKNN